MENYIYERNYRISNWYCPYFMKREKILTIDTCDHQNVDCTGKLCFCFDCANYIRVENTSIDYFHKHCQPSEEKEHIEDNLEKTDSEGNIIEVIDNIDPIEVLKSKMVRMNPLATELPPLSKKKSVEGWEAELEKLDIELGLIGWIDEDSWIEKKNYLKKFIHKQIQAARREVVEEIERIVEPEMAKKIADINEKYQGDRDCRMCGQNPERWCKQLLDELKTK